MERGQDHGIKQLNAPPRFGARSSAAQWRKPLLSTGWTQPSPWSTWKSSTTRFAPSRILLIDFMAYLAPRAIQYLGAVSQWLNPGVSIVQGSRNSNNWARILLFDVLERAQARISWVYPYQWVDDINLFAIGTQRLIEIHSPNATLELLTGLRNKGLRISSKSQIVASRPVLAKRLASLLELEGEKLKVATVGKDLGIDFSGG